MSSKGPFSKYIRNTLWAVNDNSNNGNCRNEYAQDMQDNVIDSSSFSSSSSSSYDSTSSSSRSYVTYDDDDDESIVSRSQDKYSRLGAPKVPYDYSESNNDNGGNKIHSPSSSQSQQKQQQQQQQQQQENFQMKPYYHLEPDCQPKIKTTIFYQPSSEDDEEKDLPSHKNNIFRGNHERRDSKSEQTYNNDSSMATKIISNGKREHDDESHKQKLVHHTTVASASSRSCIGGGDSKSSTFPDKTSEQSNEFKFKDEDTIILSMNDRYDGDGNKIKKKNKPPTEEVIIHHTASDAAVVQDVVDCVDSTASVVSGGVITTSTTLTATTTTTSITTSLDNNKADEDDNATYSYYTNSDDDDDDTTNTNIMSSHQLVFLPKEASLARVGHNATLRKKYKVPKSISKSDIYVQVELDTMLWKTSSSSSWGGGDAGEINKGGKGVGEGSGSSGGATVASKAAAVMSSAVTSTTKHSFSKLEESVRQAIQEELQTVYYAPNPESAKLILAVVVVALTDGSIPYTIVDSDRVFGLAELGASWRLFEPDTLKVYGGGLLVQNEDTSGKFLYDSNMMIFQMLLFQNKGLDSLLNKLVPRISCGIISKIGKLNPELLVEI